MPVNFERFVEEHWDMFVVLLSRFYPLPPSLLETYEEAWSWPCLSHNETLAWDAALIEKFTHRWRWVDLATNPGVIWDETLLNSFDKEIDWRMLAYNPSLPVSASYLERFKDKLMYLTTVIKALTPALQEATSLEVYEHHAVTEEEEEVTFENFEEKLYTLSFFPNTLPLSLYQALIEPFVSDQSIEELFAPVYNVPQRYYQLSAHTTDEHGLTPEFLFETMGHGGEGVEPAELLKAKATLINGSLQEGPARLHHIPRLRSYIDLHLALLVSEPVKEVLETFSLPPSATFVEVALKPTKIQTTTRFYILYAEEDQLYKDLRYDEVAFVYKVQGGFGSYTFQRTFPMDDPPTTPDEVWPAKSRMFGQEYPEKTSFAGMSPDQCLLSSTYDIYTHERHWIANEFVKQALEQACDGKIDFVSMTLMKIEIDPLAYEEKRDQYANLLFAPAPLNIIKSAKELYFLAKMRRLQESDTSMVREDKARDEFSDAEDALQVQFPPRFKAYFRKRHGKPGRGYQLLDIESFHQIEDDYVARHSEAYKGVVVGHNGLGDGLALLLEKKDDYALGTTLYECLHETGQLKRKRALPK